MSASRLLVDSYAWVELLADGPKAGAFKKLVFSGKELLVPSIVLAELSAKLHLSGRSEVSALLSSVADKARVVEISVEIADLAGKLKREHGLGLADAVVLATALKEDAVVVTGDKHFAKFENAVVI